MEKTRVLTPGNLIELQAALKQLTKESKILAGGTDLIIGLHNNKLTPDFLLDLSGVPELKNIKLEGGNLHLGAMASFTRIKESELVNKHARCLGEAAASVGSNQIRNAGTLGGNIGNASPAGDAIPALMALESRVKVMNSFGDIEEKDVDEIVVGLGKTSLAYDQVILEIIIPLLEAPYRSSFAKVGSRTAVTIARLNMAMVVKYCQSSNTISDVRIGLGAISTKAFRDMRVERLLEGRFVDPQSAQFLAEELSVTVQRSIPGRYSLPYKREAIKGLADDLWGRLF